MRMAHLGSWPLRNKVRGPPGHLLYIQEIDIISELLKINHYKAPRDKLICVLNCCKVIFGPTVFLLSCTISSYNTQG
jgi:hypothetical protein